MSRLQRDSDFAKKLQVLFIDICKCLRPDDSFCSRSRCMELSAVVTVYRDLPHPATTYLAPLRQPTLHSSSTRVHYVHRSADGSDYNVYFPAMGQAGQPYSRSVPSASISPPWSLPDPALVFDALLSRDSYDMSLFQPHPGGLSSLFFTFANLIIHTIFNTNTKDPSVNDTSSYLDLSVLYGSSNDEARKLRRLDGTGRLWEDVWADKRVAGMPPAFGALLVLFCRNHNVGILCFVCDL